jgi:hypothetical protein
MTSIVVSTTTTAAAATAAEPATARFWPSFVDGERTSTSVGAVQGEDRCIGFAAIRHFNKSEAARAAGVAVGYNHRAIHCSVGLKPLSQVGVRSLKRKIANKYLLHESFLSVLVLFRTAFTASRSAERVIRSAPKM